MLAIATSGAPVATDSTVRLGCDIKVSQSHNVGWAISATVNTEIFSYDSCEVMILIEYLREIY